jgi:hypothetical protein
LELIQLLIQAQEENVRLQERLDEAQAKLDDRSMIFEQAGSLAEAALRLNGIFEAADAAAAEYLYILAASAKAALPRREEGYEG